MLNLSRFLSRKFVYGGLCAALLFALLTLLDPLVRQSIFGPQIDGIPWCVWEDQIRSAARGDDQRHWWTRMLEKVGVRRRRAAGLNLDARALQPIYLQLADDSDAKVRQFSLQRLEARTKEEATSIESIFRRRLDDSDSQCRLIAACGIWHTAKDRAMISVVLPIIGDVDLRVQREAVWLLQEMAAGEPMLFEHFAPLCEAPDLLVQDSAVRSMRHFGKRGVPLLQKAMQDSAKTGSVYTVKLSAIYAASELSARSATTLAGCREIERDLRGVRAASRRRGVVSGPAGPSERSRCRCSP